jgi:hypothetical protein
MKKTRTGTRSPPDHLEFERATFDFLVFAEIDAS